MIREFIRGIVVGLAGLGVAGQTATGLLLIVALLAAVGLRTPLAFVRKNLRASSSGWHS